MQLLIIVYWNTLKCSSLCQTVSDNITDSQMHLLKGFLRNFFRRIAPDSSVKTALSHKLMSLVQILPGHFLIIKITTQLISLTTILFMLKIQYHYVSTFISVPLNAVHYFGQFLITDRKYFPKGCVSELCPLFCM